MEKTTLQHFSSLIDTFSLINLVEINRPISKIKREEDKSKQAMQFTITRLKRETLFAKLRKD